MKGVKYLLFGLMLVIIAGAFMISQDSSLGGYGELALLLAGIVYGVKGLRTEDVLEESVADEDENQI